MGGLIKGIFGGGNPEVAYDKKLEEQEHRKELAEDKARQNTMAEAKANALAEAEAKKRKDAFLSKTTSFDAKDDDDELGGKKSLLG